MICIWIRFKVYNWTKNEIVSIVSTRLKFNALNKTGYWRWHPKPVVLNGVPNGKTGGPQKECQTFNNGPQIHKQPLRLITVVLQKHATC